MFITLSVFETFKFCRVSCFVTITNWYAKCLIPYNNFTEINLLKHASATSAYFALFSLLYQLVIFCN